MGGTMHDDTTGLKRLEELTNKLESIDVQHQMILDLMPIAVMVVEQDLVLYANECAVVRSGIPAEELIGHNINGFTKAVRFLKAAFPGMPHREVMVEVAEI